MTTPCSQLDNIKEIKQDVKKNFDNYQLMHQDVRDIKFALMGSPNQDNGIIHDIKKLHKKQDYTNGKVKLHSKIIWTAGGVVVTLSFLWKGELIDDILKGLLG